MVKKLCLNQLRKKQWIFVVKKGQTIFPIIQGDNINQINLKSYRNLTGTFYSKSRRHKPRCLEKN